MVYYTRGGIMIKRPFVCIHNIVFIFLLIYMPKHYDNFIYEYRQNHPTNVYYEPVEVEMEGELISLDINKHQIVIKSDAYYLFTNISDEDIQLILQGAINYRITYNQNEAQWRSQKNRYAFDYDQYLYSNGIAGKYTVRTITPITYENAYFSLTHAIRRLKMKQLGRIYNNNRGDLESFLCAVLFNQKSEYPAYERFKKIGTSHLFAISGLHFGLFYLFIGSVFSWGSTRLRISLKIALSFIFLIWIGPVYSATRAFLMLLYSEVAKLCHRKVDFITLFCVSNLVILFWRPYALLSTSFQLSFYAYFCVAYLVPKIIQMLEKFAGFKHDILKKLSQHFLYAVLLQLFLMPITLSLFGSINLFNFLSNLVLIPIFTLVLMVALLGYLSLLLPLPSVLKSWLYDKSNTVVVYFNELSNLLPNQQMLTQYFDQNDGNMLLYLGVIFLILCAFKLSNKMKFNIMSITFSLFLISALTKEIKTITDEKLKIHCFDVGHGESNLITYKDFSMLIDTGESYSNMTSVLISEGITDLDVLVLSHAHDDHIGGYNELRHTINVNQVIANDEVCSRLNSVNEGLESFNEDGIIVLDDLIIRLGQARSESNTNDNGIWVQIHFKDFDAVFLGDYSETSIKKLILPDQIDLLKIPHHGSSTSTYPSFYEDYDVLYGVISHNFKYKMPSAHTMEILNEHQVIVISSYLNGEVIFLTDGHHIKAIDFFKHKY